MGSTISLLQQRIDSGKPILVAELSPPHGADANAVREMARRVAGKVHALGITDNRERVSMSALAAAALVAAEGVEPILHVVTRDRNRIALVSDFLGARALGVQNVLCTSGTHQTLGRFRSARSVYDLDSVQLLQTYAHLADDAQVVGEAKLNGGGSLCLGAVASPYAEPLDLQLLKLQKKAQAGARFFITQPVYDVERFEAWWSEITRRGIHTQAAILAGVEPLADLETARALAAGRPRAIIPEAVLSRLSAQADPAAQRAEGITIAVETIQRLGQLKGLRGFEVCGNGHFDAACETIAKSGLGID
jgi:methylenetetrahydrofolate reductase (NADPH)